jgi:hypothetical protein
MAYVVTMDLVISIIFALTYLYVAVLGFFISRD